MKALGVRAYAKVNLGLEVLGPRQDGYHELRTIFQTIDLHDDIALILMEYTGPTQPTPTPVPSWELGATN